MTTLRSVPLTLPGAWPRENPLPCFRDRTPHRVVPLADSVAPRHRELAGWNAGFRVLPCRMQDIYPRALAPLTLQTVVLENEFLRAEFLPELGGRLRSLIHRPSGRELLACNPVFQPANLAVRNAWFSGGIEWNVGQYGHSTLTCSPVFAARIVHADGSPGLRIYEFERVKQLCWQTDFYLPHASAFLFAHTRIANVSPREASMYWWTNIAVPERADVRVIAPAAEALHANPPVGFGQAALPRLPSYAGADATYSTNARGAYEFFMACDAAPPFVAAVDATGAGLVEASTARLGVRKLFCWGMHPGGRHWQEFLAPPGHDYLEIQAGLAPTQLHGLVMPANADWSWTEAFGLMHGDPAELHHPDWPRAVAAARHALTHALPPADLQAMDTAATAQIDQPALEYFHHGSGWGALEKARLGASGLSLPSAFEFPADRSDDETRPWHALLREGTLPADLKPGTWLVQREWRELLTASLARPGGRHAAALLHLGVMAAEAFDEAEAMRLWRASLALNPTPWAWRNLGALARLQGRHTEAVAHYAEAWAQRDALEEHATRALAREIMQLHLAVGAPAAARDFFAGLSPNWQDDDVVQVARAQAALACGDLATVEAVLERDFALIREGEGSLSDLWFGVQAWRAAGGPPPTAAQLQAARRRPLPRRLDFRVSPE